MKKTKNGNVNEISFYDRLWGKRKTQDDGKNYTMKDAIVPNRFNFCDDEEILVRVDYDKEDE